METPKRKWIAPEVRKYGDFETSTQGCDKSLGGSDGYTFMGQSIACAS